MKKKLKLIQRKRLVRKLSHGEFSITYKNNYIECDDGKIATGLFDPNVQKIYISRSSELMEKTFLHEVFHLCYYKMDIKCQNEMLKSIKSRTREFNIKICPTEVLAVHFAVFAYRALFKEDYNTENYDYQLKEMNLPKRIDKIFQKILKSIQKILKENKL